MTNQRSTLRHRVIPPSLRPPATQSPLSYSNKSQSWITKVVARLARWAAMDRSSFRTLSGKLIDNTDEFRCPNCDSTVLVVINTKAIAAARDGAAEVSEASTQTERV